jgi:protein O-mannosyl-transferase
MTRTQTPARRPQDGLDRKRPVAPFIPAAVAPDLPRPSRLLTAAICLVLALAAVAVYAQVFRYGFVQYDDGAYVFDNAMVKGGPTADNVRWAFTTFNSANWHPLAWLSLMLDCRLFGPNPHALHATNVVFHIAAALLIFLAFARMTRRPFLSALVAGIFAVHPAHVESVAWISERKDVLSAFFAALALLLYARYAERPSLLRYLPMALAFALGLMAKSMLVTLPLVFLLVDLWPLGRLQMPPRWKTLKALLIEKTPLLALTACVCVLTYLAQHRGGAVSDLVRLPFSQRLGNVSIAYATYVGNALWPAGLGVMYPILVRPATDAIMALMLLAVLTAGVLFVAPTRPYILVGWLWFLGMLVPVIGLVQVGAQLMADRYTYLPFVGLSFGAVWLVADLCAGSQTLRRAAVVLGVAVFAVLGVLAFRQASYWQSSETLFTHTIAVTCPNPIMHTTLGYVYDKAGRRDDAVAEYRKALAILPSYGDAHCALGTILYHQEKYDDALAEYKLALNYEPGLAAAHNQIGAILDHWGRHDEAMEHYKQAVEADPDMADAHANLGLQYYVHGQPADAQKEYLAALALKPDVADTRNSLGVVLEQLGKPEEAKAQYEKAIALKPDYADAHANLAHVVLRGHVQEGANSQWVKYGYSHLTKALELDPRQYVALADLGVLLASEGKLDEARAKLEASLDVKPDQAEARSNLAFVLTYLGRLDDAVTQCRESLKLEPNSAGAYYNLAIAYSRQNRFADAVSSFHASLRINPSQPQAHSMLAAALMCLGRWDDAVAECNEALKLDPSSVEAHFNLATAYASQGKTSAAAAEYSKVLSLDPSNAPARDALSKLPK